MIEKNACHAAYLQVHQTIEQACELANRQALEVQLLAVSKYASVAQVQTLWNLGHRCFGESRVQEAIHKFSCFRALKKSDLVLHMIGHLQRNKVRDAMRYFDCIQTLDSIRLADCLAAYMHEGEPCPTLYIQVNVGKEPQKYGVWPEDVPVFTQYCKDLGLPVLGYMCIPPASENSQIYFKMLQDFAEDNALEGLSMGMSADFAAAIACGATCVRVGTSIFKN